MKFVRSDNTLISASLEAMKDLVIAHGGYVHPAAAIEERDGSIRVVCDAPDAIGQTLFKVPDNLLVPVDDLKWTDSEETMQLTSYPESLSPEQREMLNLFITIYNAANKMIWIGTQISRLYAHDTELAGHIELVKPGYVIPTSSAASDFIDTRCYFSKAKQNGLSDRYCIMPLIDFVNHHASGAIFEHDFGWLSLQVNYQKKSNECFANYGKRRDPLGLALGHGYVETQSPFTNSAPVEIDFAGFGRLVISGKLIRSNHFTDPPKVEFLDDGLRLSHLSASVALPQYLPNILRLVMMASGKRRGIEDANIERAIADAPAAIIEANKNKFDAFRAYLATRPELSIASVLSEASLYQMANLETALKA